MPNLFWRKHIRKEVGWSHPELALWVNCRRDHSKGSRVTIWLLLAHSAAMFCRSHTTRKQENEADSILAWIPFSHPHLQPWSLETVQSTGWEEGQPVGTAFPTPHQYQFSIYLSQKTARTYTLKISADFAFSPYLTVGALLIDYWMQQCHHCFHSQQKKTLKFPYSLS